MHSMQHKSGYWVKASAGAFALGIWAAACSSDAPGAANETSEGAATPSSSTIGTGGAAASTTLDGSAVTTTSVGATTTGQATGAAVTGADPVTGVTGLAVDTTGSTGATGAGVGGTGSAASTGTGAGAPSTGSTATVAGLATGTASATTAGTGTTGVSEASCATRPALATPGLVNFETYDGASEALDWSFEFNDDGSGMNLLYGGFFDNSDGSGTPTLNMVGGDTSTWAVKATNTEASVWGGGIGLWLGCFNASSYTGISLAARGTTPNQNGISVSLTVDGLTEGVGTSIFVTDLFATFDIPFSEFTNESGETTNGDNIVGIAINAQMMWLLDETTEVWNPIPGAYEIVIDDISFY